MSMIRIREYYKIPIKRNMQIRIPEPGGVHKYGRVVSAKNDRVTLKFYGQQFNHPAPFHPSFNIEYCIEGEWRKFP